MNNPKEGNNKYRYTLKKRRGERNQMTSLYTVF